MKKLIGVLVVFVFIVSCNSNGDCELDGKHYSLNSSTKQIGKLPHHGGTIYEFINDSNTYIIVQDFNGIAITRK